MVSIQNKLIIQNNPRQEIVTSIIINIIVTLFSIVFAYNGLPQKVMLACNRIEPNQINCNLKEINLFLKYERETFIDRLSGVIIAPLSGEDISHIEYRVILKSGDGNFTFFGYRSEDKAQAIASEINNFIINKKQSISQVETQSELAIIPLAIGLISFTISLSLWILIILIPYSRKLTIDKTSNRIIINQKGLVVNKVIEHQINEIIDVLKEEKIDKSDDSKFEYFLILPNNKRLTLYWYYSNTWNSELEMVEKIAQFLNLKVVHRQVKI
ncbi:hypothetical protein [Anabaena sp. CCY 9402-a]|uniref:hypothetical protein n=1 Tax=Anabaena sp. CCY 9402-a TaxID=3103867 RepID=UPI0039C5C698